MASHCHKVYIKYQVRNFVAIVKPRIYQTLGKWESLLDNNGH